MEKDIKTIIDFYKTASPEELSKQADRVCRENHGNTVWLRGLVEFSNYCRRDCLYCGIRAGNLKISRYRLDEKQILEIIREGFKAGLRTFVLQSGEDDFYTGKILTALIEKIKTKTNGEAALTLSCGIRKKEEYRAFKKAGADRYLLRFETAGPDLHRHLRNGRTLEERLQALADLKELDYETGSGYMTGLPGETEEIRVQNALLCRKLELDMVGIGPFIPHPDTPLGGSPQLSFEHTLRAVSLVRLLLPRAHIPATTAAGSLDPEGREKMLRAGANIIMPNITPLPYRRYYTLYPGKICIEEDGLQCIGCLEVRARSAGKTIIKGRGDSLRRLKEAVNA